MTQTVGVQTQIGRSHPRLDAHEKLRGQAQFVGDLLVPRMLHGRVLRSTVPHALIRSIDASAAERLPGVVCVLTGADLDDIDPYYGHAIKDRPIVAIEKVRFHGEPVAAVAAETLAIAAAALDAIVVDYEDLPAIGTLHDALAEHAPLVNDRTSRPGPISVASRRPRSSAGLTVCGIRLGPPHCPSRPARLAPTALDPRRPLGVLGLLGSRPGPTARYPGTSSRKVHQ